MVCSEFGVGFGDLFILFWICVDLCVRLGVVGLIGLCVCCVVWLVPSCYLGCLFAFWLLVCNFG